MKKVVVLGTNHDIQRGQINEDAFYTHIKELCMTEGIHVIAEEINDDATHVVAKNVCHDLSIPHKIIDPNPLDYEALGVKKYHRIQYEIMQKYNLDSAPSTENSTPNVALNEFENRVMQEHNHPRELEWLRRIEENNFWPVLVICGSDHFTTFCNLLSKNGINTIPKESNWTG